MPKWTNKFNLPQPFVRAVINDPYSRGNSDFSATGLAVPPRASALIERYGDELEIDVSSRVASIIGQGAHSIAERAARPGIDTCEKRFFGKFIVDGASFTVSSQIDLFEGDTQDLYDWKSTKAYAFSQKSGSGQKPEWISQLNVAAELMRRSGLSPRSLNIIALLKDWSAKEAEPFGSLPKTEVVSVRLPMWDSSEVVQYIEDRIRAQVRARQELPLCTSKEMWGGRRCSGGWCDASSVCEQYKQMTKTGVIE